MVAIMQQDAPWAFGYNPYAGSVHHQWVGNVKPGPVVHRQVDVHESRPGVARKEDCGVE